jgi:spermidine/putrescine transport system ATP-binding protein
MTMADGIAVMNAGRIEQLGEPRELYERPRTAFVAGFLGVSNLLPGEISGPDRVTLRDGTTVEVPAERLVGHDGPISIGIRPEKIRPAANERNALDAVVVESAYIGVSTQYIVETAAGSISLYVQNERPGAPALSSGDRLTVGWDPNSTFIVKSPEDK